MQHLYLVAYDVADDKRRSKIAEQLEGVGERLQYSVFRCPLDEAALARVANELNELVNNAHDQVLFFNLGPADGHGALPAKVIGKPVKAVERTVIVI